MICVGVIQGGMVGAERLRDCGALEGIVKKHVEKGGFYAAICAAPAVVLGSWGLLKGLKVRFGYYFFFNLFSDKLDAEYVLFILGMVT